MVIEAVPENELIVCRLFVIASKTQQRREALQEICYTTTPMKLSSLFSWSSLKSASFVLF